MAETKSILVVLSGGQDSTTCLFQAIHTPGVMRVGAVSFDYSQRHVRELDSAGFIYAWARDHCPSSVLMYPTRIVKRLGSIFEGSSPLTKKDQPLETYSDINEMDAKLTDRVELTFVPGRNLVFLGLACSYAVSWGYDAVMTGVNGADNANYPDCTPEFIAAMETAAQLATRSNVKILTPLQGMSKKEIVHLAMGLPHCMEALAFSHTDYAGDYPPSHNHASVLRAHGFAEAGVEDPLIQRAKSEGLL